MKALIKERKLTLNAIKDLAYETAKWFAKRPEDWDNRFNKDVVTEWAKYFEMDFEEAQGWLMHISLCVSNNPHLLKPLNKVYKKYWEEKYG